MTVGTAVRWWKLDYFRVAWVGGGWGLGALGAGGWREADEVSACTRSRQKGIVSSVKKSGAM